MWPIKSILDDLPHGLGSNSIAPHVFARSALFSSQNYRGHGRPHYTEPKELAAVGSMKISQLYGWQLDQQDADVMYELLRRVFAQGDGDRREARIVCKRLDLLHSLGRTKGGKSIKLLDESIDRLTLATYQLDVPGLATGISRLVLKVLKRERGELDGQEWDYDILLDLELAKLFQFRQWVLLSKAERTQLLNDPLARALHTYYASHDRPFPILPATLKALTGRNTMRDDKWITTLEAALARLKKATGWFICEIQGTGKFAGKVMVVKKKPPAAKKTALKPAKIEQPAPAASLASLTEEQVYLLTVPEAEALLPPEDLAACRAQLATVDPAEAADPKLVQIIMVNAVMQRWRAEQARINPEYDLTDI